MLTKRGPDLLALSQELVSFDGLVLRRTVAEVRRVSVRRLHPIGANFGVRELAPAFSQAACCRCLRHRRSHPKTVAERTGASSLGKSGSKLPHSKVSAHEAAPRRLHRKAPVNGTIDSPLLGRLALVSETLPAKPFITAP